MTEHCSIPRCRGTTEYDYLGRSLCARHWQQLADADTDSAIEAATLALMSLRRDESGEVVRRRKLKTP